MNPRQQGDLGEASAIDWLTRWGAGVLVPLFHSPDYDLLAEKDDRFHRIQVKTTTSRRLDRWEVHLKTCGGNQSWTGVSKLLMPSRYDYLFVLAGDGRRWFIPSEAVEGGSGIRLGGPKYAAFEVDRGEPIPGGTPAKAGSRIENPLARGDARAAKGSGL